MSTYNLIDHPWIPVRWASNAAEPRDPRVSLTDAFNRSAEIADLDCAPHERIALTRLLVCVAHAALGAPEDAESWDGFGEDLETAVRDYLHREDIHLHFNLLGEGPRFLQEDLPSSGDPVPASKLFPSLATGNNPTLLDHGGMLLLRTYEPSQLALALLAFQNFYPLYGAGYKGRGPCSDGNSLHTLLDGNDLRATIRSNMLDSETIDALSPEGVGRPIWECHSKSDLDRSTRTFLGRLVPRHRSLRLTDDLTGFHHRKLSLQYPGWEPCREPSVAVIITKKDERRLLPARIDRAIWRDLHSLTAVRTQTSSSSSAQPPAVLDSHPEAIEEERVRIWTGALITDLKAKILDTVESSFTLPSRMFTEEGRLVYASGVEFAETTSKKLYGAVKTYWQRLRHENAPTPEAQEHYWHSLDQSHGKLIDLAGAYETLRGKPAIGTEGAEDAWTRIIRNAAIDAFQRACPRTTPRQVEAYATGIKPLLRALFPKARKKIAKASGNQHAKTQPIA